MPINNVAVAHVRASRLCVALGRVSHCRSRRAANLYTGHPQAPTLCAMCRLYIGSISASPTACPTHLRPPLCAHKALLKWPCRSGPAAVAPLLLIVLWCIESPGILFSQRSRHLWSVHAPALARSIAATNVSSTPPFCKQNARFNIRTIIGMLASPTACPLRGYGRAGT